MKPRSVTVETHISTLFFTQDRVFKILKPVETGFLDHRDPSVRCAAASREYELNERMAPDVYLGTADVIEHGLLADRFIVMKRLPDDRSMTSLLGRNALTKDHVRDVARAIATFHSNLAGLEPPGPVTEMQRTLWDNNSSELTPFVGDVIAPEDDARVTRLYTTWLDAHEELLEARATAGYMRDGHGDLLADDIFCLEDGPAILDCLAFRDDLRLIDVLDDIAFLAMDLHRLAGPMWAQLLMRYYLEFSGEHHPGSLAHYYVAYRAHVRCKIACLRIEAHEDHWVQLARQYHDLCLDQLERARLRMILVGGGPGSGKTSLSNALGKQFGCAVLSSDEIRKDLAGVERTVRELAEPDQGLYTAEQSSATYHELMRQAEALLRAGETVILDASWTTDEFRKIASAVAAKTHAQVIPIECQIPLGVAKERVARRFADPTSTSDATPEIVEHLAGIRAPWPEAVAIDGTQSFAEIESVALRAIKNREHLQGSQS